MPPKEETDIINEVELVNLSEKKKEEEDGQNIVNDLVLANRNNADDKVIADYNPAEN